MIKTRKHSLLFLILNIILLHHVEGSPSLRVNDTTYKPPYPKSTRFDSIEWHWDKYYTAAPGSDIWSLTWGKDNNIYTSWGDGGGFLGTNSLGRVSLGFARIEGTPDNLKAKNVWGGINPEHPATFTGKCCSLISIDGILYGWILMQNVPPPDPSDFRLAWSTDSGATWNLSEWAFPSSGSFFPYNFLNYGKDNSGSRDNYVYSYGTMFSLPGKPATNYYMMRVDKKHILERSYYEFFAGIDSSGNPDWSSDVDEREPIFTDPNGTDGNVVYNPGLKLYILTSGHRAPGSQALEVSIGRLGIFTAPEPWGPWSTVAYYDNWGGFGDLIAVGYQIPIKWISEDGKNLWIVFSSTSHLDRFNVVKATLIEKNTDTTGHQTKDETPPDIPKNLKAEAVNEHQVKLSWSSSIDKESGIKSYEVWKNGIVIAETDSTFYIDSNLTDNTFYTYNISAINNIGLQSGKSDSLYIRTAADTSAPKILRVYFQDDSTEIFLCLNKEVDKNSAEDINNYKISNGLKVFHAEFDSSFMTIKLTTSPHERQFIYTLTAGNIYDKATVPNFLKTSQFEYIYPEIYLVNNLIIHTGKFYELMDSFEENKPVYTDSVYKFDKVAFPDIIKNPFIKTSFSDRNSTTDSLLSFNLNIPADIFILHDNRIIEKPIWLNQFYNTQGQAVMGGSHFTFYKKYFHAGIITLGGNVTEKDTGNYNMYSVIIKPGMLTGIDKTLAPNDDFKLFQNYPNPFNPSTIISFRIPRIGTVLLRIYNSLGENIACLTKDKLYAGSYDFRWDGKDANGMKVASGVYFYELTLSGDKSFRAVNKMVYLK